MSPSGTTMWSRPVIIQATPVSRNEASHPRRDPQNLRKQSPRVLGGADFFHPDRHRGGTMRNLIDLRSQHHVIEGAIEDLIFAPHHFLFFPEQLLEVL